VVLVGPFEEEEKGIIIASDVVKVQGEDLDTPEYLRGYRARGMSAIFNRWCVGLGSREEPPGP